VGETLERHFVFSSLCNTGVSRQLSVPETRNRHPMIRKTRMDEKKRLMVFIKANSP
jgi:hypothetical protein